MSSTTPPIIKLPPRPEPLQFTLRSIFVVMTALALLLGLVMQLGCFGVPAFVVLACIVIGIYKRDWQYVLAAFGIVILVALLIPMGTHREYAYRVSCLVNLRQIGLALHCYHDRYGCFPPAYIADEDGKPMHSWRVLLLPYLEEGDLYERYRFDEPWDGPNNRKLHNAVLSAYCCPSEGNNTMTCYVAVVGPRVAWPGSTSTKFTDFSDGTGETIMVVEATNLGIHWMEPRDLHSLQMKLRINSKSGQGISSKHTGGAHVLFADGSARFLPDGFPPKTLAAMLTIDGGEEVAPEEW